jgi:hypothetical protein
MGVRTRQQVIVYHDDSTFKAGGNFCGHALFLVPTTLTVTSSTPLFGEWSHNYHPLDELCSKLDELRATTRTAGKLHFKEITGTKWGASDLAHRGALALATDALKAKRPEQLRYPLHCKLAVLFFSKETDLALYGGESRDERRLRHSETVLRILLKGALHFLYDDLSSVAVRGIVTDGQPDFRPLNDSRVMRQIVVDGRRGRTSLRKNIQFARGARIVHLPSDHREYAAHSIEASHANMLQLTDLLLGGTVRACHVGCPDHPRIPHRGAIVADKKAIVAYPLKQVLQKERRGRGLRHSGHYRSFSVSYVDFSGVAVTFRPIPLKDLDIDPAAIPMPFLPR